MKFGVTTRRIIVYAFKNLKRNAWINVATVFVLVLSLLSVNTLVAVHGILDRSVSLLEERIDLSVFFKNETPSAVLEHARFFMASLPQTAEVRLLDPEESLAAFRELHEDDPDIQDALRELEQNPFGASLVIRAHRTEDYPFLMGALQNPQFDFAIESKTYDDHAEAIARIRDIGKSARLFGAILIAVFAFFSVLIMYNAVRVAIYTHREEIGIMRLVGASGSFVRAPFVVEGLILAVLALALAAGFIAGIIYLVEPRMAGLFGGADPGLSSYFLARVPQILAIEGGGLLLLVALSAWAAVGKYLKR